MVRDDSNTRRRSTQRYNTMEIQHRDSSSMPDRRTRMSSAECARAMLGRFDDADPLATLTEVMTHDNRLRAATDSSHRCDSNLTATSRDAELERADPRGQAATGRLAPDPGTPLSAGRSDPLRRSPGRQLQAQPARRGRAERAARSSSAASISWPRRPISSRATRSRFTSPTWPPGAAWPTWPTSNRSRPRGKTSARSSTPTTSCR